jgi:predicted porin
LKAIFQFEWGVAADTGGGPGDGPPGARYTWVGLAGNFGSVTLGRIGTPSDNYMIPTTVQGFGTMEPIHRFRAIMGGTRSGINSEKLLDGARWNHSIAYSSPKFSGLDFMAIYSFGEKVNGSKNCGTPANPVNCADTSDAGKLGLGARYVNGPLYLAAIYHAHADDDTNTIAGYGAKGWGLGGAYDFKVVKLYANYFRAKANHGGAATAANAGSDKEVAWSLGVGVPVSSAGTVMAEYAQYKDYMNDRNGVVPTGRNPGHQAKGYSVGYKHVLSKRTTLYAYVSAVDNDQGIDAGWAGNRTNAAGEKQTNFVAGIVHFF